MAACFYGSGPTYWELKGVPPPGAKYRPGPAQISQPPDAEELGDIGSDRLVGRDPSQPIFVPQFGAGLRPGYEPRGAAARKLKPLTETPELQPAELEEGT
jgi:hypothetical protein